MVDNIWLPSAIDIDGTQFNSVEDPSSEPQIQHLLNFAAGSPYPNWQGIVGIKPMVTFQTKEIAKALTLIPLAAGVAVTAGTVDWIRLSHGAVRDNATKRQTYNRGYAVITNISSSQDQEATASITIYSSWDGTTLPLVWSDSTPRANIDIAEKFTLGVAKINGTLLEGARSISIDSGIEIEQRAGDGEVYPTAIFVKRATPRITISGDNLAWGSTYLSVGTKTTASETAIFFKKIEEHAAVYANASTQHIKIVTGASQGLVIPGSTSGSDPAQQTLMISPVVGTNAILTVSTGVAIS